MDSDDDIQPLIHNDVGDQNEVLHQLNTQAINVDPEFDQIVYGFRRSRWRTILVYILSTLSCGIPFLLFHWCPKWFLYATSERCCFQLADQVLVVETYQRKCKSFYIHKILDKNIADTSGSLNQGFQDEFENEKSPIEIAEDLQTPVHLDDGTTLTVQHYRYFRHKKQNLVWDGARAQWSLLVGIERGATCSQLQAMGSRAPSSERRARMLNIYGLNEIKVPVQSVLTLVLLEVFNPFYVFQLFTIAVWLAEPYYYYCVAVVLMSSFGVATSVIQTKKNQESLRATVEAHDTVELWDGRLVDSRFVSPGDVIVLPPRCTLQLDAALLSGSATLNESMLTGESVPVTKTALLRIDKPFDMKEHSHSVLFCGTKVIQIQRTSVHEPVRALVLRTGYNTQKGQLVRSILYPAPADFKFDQDSYKFIGILALIAAVGLAYTVALKAYRSLTPGDIALKALDIITIVIPPALPAAMTVGRLYAVNRLKAARVSCLNTRAVNVSGSIDCFCFDKTGTLTEDGLDMWGVVPVDESVQPRRLARAVRDPAALNDLHDLKLGMAACHSLALLDGQLAGDPLDLKMFESTKWTLEKPDAPAQGSEVVASTVLRPRKSANINVDDIHMPLELGVVQQHQFVSSLARSAVVARMRGEQVLRAYCKGAPETVSELCLPHTVPENLNEVLSSYAEKGYRVIAMATKIIETTMKELETMTREEVEKDLEFVGLVILENRLKAATTGIIRELKEADIHVVMITGDNVHTAVSVARECGILGAGERAVRLLVERRGESPRLYCQSERKGVPIGGRVALQRSSADPDGSWGGADSGRGSWRGSWRGSGGSAPSDLENGVAAPDYKFVVTGDAWRVFRGYLHNPLILEAIGVRVPNTRLRRGPRDEDLVVPKSRTNILKYAPLTVAIRLLNEVLLEQYGAAVPRVVSRGAVFARMSSDQKQRLVLEYQALGYYVGMCGDGANDCGALRAAHTGISLSELESSVAAPFTSQHPDIVCVTRVLREGRAALSTSFGVFKFMIAYSLTEFLSVGFLYYFDSNLTDFQFLYIDVGLIVNFAFFFGMTEAYTGKLCKIPPLTSLLGLEPLLSLIGQMLLITAAQFLSYYALTYFPWYERHTFEGEEANKCWENYAIFTVSMFQYIIMPIVFSHGAPYRRSVVTNKQLMSSMIIMLGICIYITVSPPDWLAEFLELKMPLNSLMSYMVLAIASFNFVLALFFERIIIQYMMERKLIIPKFLKEKKVRKTPHLLLRRQMTNMDYLDCESVKKYDKETGVSDSSSGVLT